MLSHLEKTVGAVSRFSLYLFLDSSRRALIVAGLISDFCHYIRATLSQLQNLPSDTKSRHILGENTNRSRLMESLTQWSLFSGLVTNPLTSSLMDSNSEHFWSYSKRKEFIILPDYCLQIYTSLFPLFVAECTCSNNFTSAAFVY